MEFEKKKIIMEFCEIILTKPPVARKLAVRHTKPPVARKLAVRHTKLVCLTASFQATGGFRFKLLQNACMVYKHAYLNILLLLQYPFMLCGVKLPLKGADGGPALKSPGNYIVDHGKSWKNHGIVFLNFCGNPERSWRGWCGDVPEYSGVWK